MKIGLLFSHKLSQYSEQENEEKDYEKIFVCVASQKGQMLSNLNRI